MEEAEKQERHHDRDEIYGKSIRAGKRTYFFDVRATRGNDYYLTITESKKRFNEDGSHQYQKHKIFLYKEDFEKFTEALDDVIGKVADLNRDQPHDHHSSSHTSDKPLPSATNFTEVNFEDLGSSEETGSK